MYAESVSSHQNLTFTWADLAGSAHLYVPTSEMEEKSLSTIIHSYKEV